MRSMCGRATNEDELRDIALGVDAALDELDGASWRPSYNLAPTQHIPVLGLREGARALRTMRWGLVPSWTRDEASARKSMGQCFNARGETLREKASFRAAFAKRRCLVVFTGFYEWARAGGQRTPFWLHPREGRYWTFAAVWEPWRNPASGELWRTVAVVTTTPNARMAAVHDRMPVILSGDAGARWLAADARPDELSSLIAPCPDAWIAARPVGPAIGNVRNDGPSLVAPVTPDDDDTAAPAGSRVA